MGRAAASVTETAQSASWTDDASAPVSVIVATRNRAMFICDLLDALEAQTLEGIEIVVVDDASDDETWDTLAKFAAVSARRVLAIRLAERSGPSRARNIGAGHGHAPWLAFTDDDCRPRAEWLAALLGAGRDAAIVQGRTAASPGDRPGPWHRTIVVDAPSPLYETCNLGVRRDAFLAAGGFPELALLPGPAARGFGEDAALGAAVAAAGGRAWAQDAVVEHRWLPGDYTDHLDGLRRLAGFPALASAVPEVAHALWKQVFLSRRTAVFDAAVVGVALAASRRRWWPLGAAAPYAVTLHREALSRPGAPVAVRMGQLALGDAIGLAALLRGSIRARRPVL